MPWSLPTCTICAPQAAQLHVTPQPMLHARRMHHGFQTCASLTCSLSKPIDLPAATLAVKMRLPDRKLAQKAQSCPACENHAGGEAGHGPGWGRALRDGGEHLQQQPVHLAVVQGELRGHLLRLPLPRPAGGHDDLRIYGRKSAVQPLQVAGKRLQRRMQPL